MSKIVRRKERLQGLGKGNIKKDKVIGGKFPSRGLCLRGWKQVNSYRNKSKVRISYENGPFLKLRLSRKENRGLFTRFRKTGGTKVRSLSNGKFNHIGERPTKILTETEIKSLQINDTQKCT